MRNIVLSRYTLSTLPHLKSNIKIENPCEGCITSPRYYTLCPHESVISKTCLHGTSTAVSYLSLSVVQPTFIPCHQSVPFYFISLTHRPFLRVHTQILLPVCLPLFRLEQENYNNPTRDACSTHNLMHNRSSNYSFKIKILPGEYDCYSACMTSVELHVECIYCLK